MAVVELAQRDIERLVHEAAALERPLILAVLYSWEELNAFFEQALKPTVVGDSAISIGVAPDDNRVQLELTRADPELVKRITAWVPADAFRVHISPGARWTTH